MAVKKNFWLFFLFPIFALAVSSFFLPESWLFPKNETQLPQRETIIIEENTNNNTMPKNEEQDERFELRETQLLTGEVLQNILASSTERQIALLKSENVKGVYMTEYIANTPSSINFKNIIKLLEETELNAVVIDIKEMNGQNLPNSLKNLIDELHGKNIWVIARICVFRDNSLIKVKPELYLKKKILNSTSSSVTTSELWRDSGRGYWLDPASPAVQNYLVNFSKKAIDFGFDELQFDYIRFPSDGKVDQIVYPFYDGKKEKYEIIQEFFRNLSDSLRSYKSSIILSVDLFGYVASEHQALTIGQRTKDAADVFDYVSFMLYPSHFYSGFRVNADQARGLPLVYFPYNSASTSQIVSNNPYLVILRSILTASDFFSQLGSKTKIRPWLQDFNLKYDTDRGIYYDAGKVKTQIQAAKDAGASGWLLWNSSNVYTKAALRLEENKVDNDF